MTNLNLLKLTDSTVFKEYLTEDFVTNLVKFLKDNDIKPNGFDGYFGVGSFVSNIQHFLHAEKHKISGVINYFVENGKEELISEIIRTIIGVLLEDKNNYLEHYYLPSSEKEMFKVIRGLHELGKSNSLVADILKEKQINYNKLFFNMESKKLTIDLQKMDDFFYFLKEQQVDLYPNLFKHLKENCGFEINKKEVNILIQLLFLYNDLNILDEILEIVPKIKMNDSELSGIKLKELEFYLKKKPVDKDRLNKYNDVFNDDSFINEVRNTVSLVLDVAKLDKKLKSWKGYSFIEEMNYFLDENKDKYQLLSGFCSNKDKLSKINFLNNKLSVLVQAEVINRFEFEVPVGTNDEFLVKIKDFFNTLIQIDNLSYKNFKELANTNLKVMIEKDLINKSIKSGKENKITI